jgi:hypothetical protein
MSSDKINDNRTSSWKRLLLEFSGNYAINIASTETSRYVEAFIIWLNHIAATVFLCLPHLF